MMAALRASTGHPPAWYGLSSAVQEHSPVYRWLAREGCRPWPESLRQVEALDGQGTVWAAVLPIYSASGALYGSWHAVVDSAGTWQSQHVAFINEAPATAAIRLIPQPAPYMALVAEVVPALRQWARHGGPIWCPWHPDLLASAEPPAECDWLAVAWAEPGGPAERAEAARVRDRMRRAGRQAVAVPAAGVECLLGAERSGIAGGPSDDILEGLL